MWLKIYVEPFSLSLSYTAKKEISPDSATQGTLALQRLSVCVCVINVQRDSRHHGGARCL